MLKEDPYTYGSIALRGWLHKVTRFDLFHHLKKRYFVLMDTELRYYKYSADNNPAGIIKLKHFQSVQLQKNNDSLFGFRIMSKLKDQKWIPTLYAESKEERQLWIDRIQEAVNRLRFATCQPSRSNNACCGCSILSESGSTLITEEYTSVLDKWLDKLNLHDDNGGEAYGESPPTQSSAAKEYSKKNKSFDSFQIADSAYKSDTSNSASRTSSGNSDSITIFPSSTSTSYYYSSSLSSTSSDQQPSIESQRAKYTKFTTHQQRSTSKFQSKPDIIIPLSPPPPRRG